MKNVMVALVMGSVLLLTSLSFAKDVHVKGYYRKDGTYVGGHTRSSPDNNKWNNYGPSKNEYERTSPYMRDSDRDGTPNYLDRDDNNDGRHDDFEKNQYGR